MIHKWARAYSLVRHYSLMTTNIAESLNSTFKHAHKLPITTLVELVRDMMQRWFHDKRNATERIKTQLIKWALERILKTLDAS